MCAAGLFCTWLLLSIRGSGGYITEYIYTKRRHVVIALIEQQYRDIDITPPSPETVLKLVLWSEKSRLSQPVGT